MNDGASAPPSIESAMNVRKERMNATSEDTIMAEAENDSNDFRAWMKSLGFNAKQVSAAGELVGMSPSLAGHSSRGLRELTQTERLAMTAASIGLPQWNEDTRSEIEAVRAVYLLFKQEIDTARLGFGDETQAILAIRALIRSEAHRLVHEERAKKSDLPETDQTILALLREAMRAANVR